VDNPVASYIIRLIKGLIKQQNYRSTSMRIQQLIAFLMISVMAPFVMAQDYTPSAEVTAAIVAAQADGNVTDAEAAALAQAIAADGGNAAAVATTLSASAGASAVQVAAGLAAVGQTQNQIANTLAATGVTTQAAAQTTAQQGQTAAVNAGAAVVATRTQVTAAANAGTLVVNGSGLVTDSSGKAVIVNSASDQILMVKAIIEGNKNNGGTTDAATNQNLTNVINSALSQLGTSTTVSTDANSSLDDLLAAADKAINVAEETTGTDLDGNGDIGVSPSTVS